VEGERQWRASWAELERKAEREVVIWVGEGMMSSILYIGHDSRASLPKVVSGGDGREMGAIVISYYTFKYIKVS